MELKSASGFKSYFTPKRILIGVGVLAALGIAQSSVLMTDAGYTYVHQNNVTGSLDVFTEPGIHFRMPFLSKITRYDQVVTVSFGNNQGEVFYQRLPALQVRFADTYTGQVPATFRFKLSYDPEQLKTMHREFRSNDNLIDTMLIKNARNVTVITSTQYTGEEFFQGGLNQFKAQLSDQLSNGIYTTERRQVEVEQVDLVPVGFDQEDSNKLQATKQLVWKTVPITDKSGNPVRQDNPLKHYGITVTQVTIGDPKPEDQLDKLLTDKKNWLPSGSAPFRSRKRPRPRPRQSSCAKRSSVPAKYRMPNVPRSWPLLPSKKRLKWRGKSPSVNWWKNARRKISPP